MNTYRFVGPNGEVEEIDAESYEAACVELVGRLGWGVNDEPDLP